MADKRDFKASELPAWAASLQPSQYGRFLQLVAYELERRHARWDLGEGGMHMVRDDGVTFDLGLGKLARQCSLAGEESWSGLIQHHFAGMDSLRAHEAERDALLADFDQVRDRLRLRLYPDSYLQHSPIACWGHAPGFIVALVLDLPKALAVLKADERAQWPISNDDLYHLALHNTVQQEERPRVESFSMAPYGHGKLLTGGNLFVTTHALMLANYIDQVSDAGALLSVPDQHHAVVVPFDAEHVIDFLGPLLYLTRSLFAQATGPISPDVYWVTKEGMEVVRGDLEGERIRLHAPVKLMLLLDGRVPEYLPISVPETPVPRLPQWYRKGKKRKGRRRRS